MAQKRITVQPNNPAFRNRPGFRVISVRGQHAGEVLSEHLYEEDAYDRCDWANRPRRAAFVVTNSEGVALYGRLY